MVTHIKIQKKPCEATKLPNDRYQIDKWCLEVPVFEFWFYYLLANETVYKSLKISVHKITFSIFKMRKIICRVGFKIKVMLFSEVPDLVSGTKICWFISFLIGKIIINYLWISGIRTTFLSLWIIRQLNYT